VSEAHCAYGFGLTRNQVQLLEKKRPRVIQADIYLGPFSDGMTGLFIYTGYLEA
jgi:hypothetical protein